MSVSVQGRDGKRMEKLRTRVNKYSKGTVCVEFGDELLFSVLEILMPDISIRTDLKAKRRLKRNLTLGSFIIQPDSDQWHGIFFKPVIDSFTSVVLLKPYQH